LYGIVNAEGLIRSGIANNVLVVAVDLQSRMLARDDKDALFLFGDGAGATIVTSDSNAHRITQKILSADSRGLSMARREFPGYYLPGDPTQHDAWIRVDGRALFKFATTSFAKVIHDVVALSGWQHEDVSWVVPHQANARILKAAARKAGIPFEKFYLNIERVGNTSSASIPNALIDASKFLRANDKLLLCSVGAGITYAAVTIEW
jgi:3-oxoacyl-[acyl-carrier-protein] synthase-3